MLKYYSLKKRFSPFVHLLLFILILTAQNKVVGQVAGVVVPDSVLKEQLTRAVQIWKLGKPLFYQI